MASNRLGIKQREVLLEWINDRSGTFSIRDVELEYDIHYQTAFNWVRQLETEGLVQVVDKAGRTNLYAPTPPVGGQDPESMDARALRIHFGKDREELSIAEWASTRHNNAALPSAAAGMLYLFVRSYYYEAPDHQHLRGVASPTEVRAMVEKILKRIENEAAVIRQLLALRAPWVEGPSFGLRFGNPVAGFGMTEAVEMAQVFQREVLGYKETPYKEAPKEIDEEESP